MAFPTAQRIDGPVKSAVVQFPRFEPDKPLSIAPVAMMGVLMGVAISANYPTVLPQGHVVSYLCVAFSLVVYRALSPSFPRGQAALAVCVALLLGLTREPWQVPILYAGPLLLVKHPKDTLLVRWLLPAVIVTTLCLLADQTGLLWAPYCRITSFLSANLSRRLGGINVVSGSETLSAWPAIAIAAIVALYASGPKTSKLAVAGFLLAGLASALSLGMSNAAPLIIVVTLIFALAPLKMAPGQSNRHFAICGAVSTLLFFGLVLFEDFGLPTPVHSKKIVFVDGGLKTLKVGSGPFLESNPIAQAEFGAFPILLQDYGWTVTVIPESFRPDQIDGNDVLCVINPQDAFRKDQVEGIERYVRGGGHLLVLGDHTNIGGIRGPLNQVLGFTQIAFNFDSAIPNADSPNWRDGVQPALTPQFARFTNDQIDISVGASLSCGQDARVDLLGHGGFSDVGNVANPPSYLGGMQRTPSEQIGGLPLVADERIGSGSVQVWGDTSGFQDGSLTSSYQFLMSDMNTMIGTSILPIDPLAVCLTLSLLFAIIVVCLPYGTSAILAASVAGAFAATILESSTHNLTDPPSSGVIGVYDTSHSPQYPNDDISQSTSKLCRAVTRLGGILLDDDPFHSRSLETARWCVICAPTKPYSEAEAKRLSQYVAAGGRLIIASGWQNIPATRELLAQFGMSEIPVHCGRATGLVINENSLNSFLTGVEKQIPAARLGEPTLDMLDSCPIVTDPRNAVMSWAGSPVLAQTHLGKGKVILIGDSRFATDQCLGEAFTVRIGPANLAYWCLQ